MLSGKGARLAIFPFLSFCKGVNILGKLQFTVAEVSKTKEIAMLTIRFFDRVEPLALAGSFNQMWAVC